MSLCPELRFLNTVNLETLRAKVELESCPKAAGLGAGNGVQVIYSTLYAHKRTCVTLEKTLGNSFSIF